MKQFLGALWLLSFFLCSAQNEEKKFESIVPEEQKEWNAFQNMSYWGQIEMASETELGQKLHLCITLVDKTTKRPLEDQKVLLYQRATDGDFHTEIEGDQKSARIKGTGFTDEKGRLYVRTILPGNDAQRLRTKAKRIHALVYGATPEAYDIHFKQYTSKQMQKFAKWRHQYPLADLKLTNNNQLIGFVTIEVKNP